MARSKQGFGDIALQQGAVLVELGSGIGFLPRRGWSVTASILVDGDEPQRAVSGNFPVSLVTRGGKGCARAVWTKTRLLSLLQTANSLPTSSIHFRGENFVHCSKGETMLWICDALKTDIVSGLRALLQRHWTNGLMRLSYIHASRQVR